MSKIYSFRLDEDNPREAQARQVIEAWASRGYSLRYILVEAILAYANKEARQTDLSSALEQIITLLQELKVEPGPGSSQQSKDMRLSQPFLEAISKNTRAGLRVE